MTARQANAAWDRQDFAEFDRLRDLDEALRKMPTEELEAVLMAPPVVSTNTPPPRGMA